MWLKGRWGQKLQWKMSIYRIVYKELWPHHLQCLCEDFPLILVSLPPQSCELESGEEGMGGREGFHEVCVGNYYKKQGEEQGELALRCPCEEWLLLCGCDCLSLNLYPFQRPVEKQSLLFKCLKPR